MFCKKCGKQVEDGSSFCPYCGADLREQQEEVVDANFDEPTPSRGPWKAFAIVGYVLGIVGFATSFLIFGMDIAIFGIVFSALGKKTTDEDAKAKAEKGLKLSIAGTIISFVLLFVLIVVAAVLVSLDILNGENSWIAEFIERIMEYVEQFQ